MEPVDAKRKLAAILMADVVGYSRLMGQDEEATVEAPGGAGLRVAQWLPIGDAARPTG